MKTYYILDTSFGFGVYRNGWLVQEFDTEDEAYAYINAEKEKENRA